MRLDIGGRPSVDPVEVRALERRLGLGVRRTELSGIAAGSFGNGKYALRAGETVSAIDHWI
ncbi:hypothetical protein D0Q02_31005 [Micromonospora craniellae]|uniref:Uncharacterized protein n=1 Tax=Micromonospora craniellae TaxID=2294034 RepID=A0A372FQJ5_9ACTN|nr:hypothetical protein D0Q02_31005 [Micromonospora craniellae]